MRYLLALFVLTWGLWRVLWMGQRQPGNDGVAPKVQSEARTIFLLPEILQELKDQGIHLPPEWETRIRTAVLQQQAKSNQLASQSYAILQKAQVKPNEPAINLLERSKKLGNNFALLQDALKAPGK